MRVRIFCLALVCIFGAAAVGLAAPVKEEKKPALGAHFFYTSIPSAFISPAYEEYQSVSAYGYGIWTSYGFTQFDLYWRVTNWDLMIGEGKWRARGDAKDERFWVETDLGMVSLDMSVLWKWRVHKAVEPFVGPTFGVGFLYGDVEIFESDEDGKRLEDTKENKNAPPVLPVGGFIGGCRFYPHENFRISVDLGFLNGLAAGLSLGYAF